MVKAISKNIDEAKKHLLNSCPIIYPTDTLYSFGAMANDDVAIKKINKLKKRTSPISIIVSDIKEIEKYGHIHNKHKGLINNIFPGKYTILLKAKKHSLSRLIQNKSNLIGIRIPKESFCINLASALSTPIITTSINEHGSPPLTNIETIKKTYPEIKIYYNKRILDSKGSTILDLSNEQSISTVRKGDGKIIK